MLYGVCVCASVCLCVCMYMCFESVESHAHMLIRSSLPPSLPTSLSLCVGPNVYRGMEQQKGMGMVPKRAVNVMSCQIARFLQLTQNSIIPIGYHVQRKVKSLSLTVHVCMCVLLCLVH